MVDLIFNERTTGSEDWATILFVLCFALIAVNRTVSGNRFTDFIRLGYSDKYMKIYKDSGNILSGFTISFFIIQLISFTFLIQFLLSYYGLTEKTNWVTFIQILTFISFFILSKYLIEKIIATSFNIEEFSETFNLHKVSYRAYIGLILLPVNIILFYNNDPQPFVIYIILALIFLASIISRINKEK